MAKPADGKYTVRHAVLPPNADHWLLILEGFEGTVDTDDATFMTGDIALIKGDKVTKQPKEQRP